MEKHTSWILLFLGKANKRNYMLCFSLRIVSCPGNEKKADLMYLHFDIKLNDDCFKDGQLGLAKLLFIA